MAPTLRTSNPAAALCLLLLSTLLLGGCSPAVTGSGRTAQLVDKDGRKLKPEPYYTGYSRQYAPVRDNLARGKIDAVEELLTAEEEALHQKKLTDREFAKELRLVGLMERSSLALQRGETQEALRYCRLAGDLLKERERESYLAEGASTAGSFFTNLAGAGEYGRYNAPGYEKVMLLNIASMAWLLEGDERAFNIARQAIALQDDERRLFEEEMARHREDEKKSEEQRGKNEEKNTRKTLLLTALDEEFSKYDDRAVLVASAFVNPFADYVNGMVEEFKSVKVKSLMSNARIAYSNALKLNPKSRVLQQAVKETTAKRSAGRLIQVVALDGFAPEKRVLSIPIDRDLDVELPTYTPIPNQVAKIIVTTSKGRHLATLSSVADLDALAFRHQKDSLPYIKTLMVTSLVRDTAIVVTGDLLAGVGGFFRKFVDKHQEPDTTSWMTLPARILAARIHPGKGLKTLRISSYDVKGRRLATKTVRLGAGGRHFVLVRSINKTLSAWPSKKIWTRK